MIALAKMLALAKRSFGAIVTDNAKNAAHPIVKRRYEATSKGTRTKNWIAPATDANAAINDPVILRNRARDLVRNNPWAAKAVSVIVNNIIGSGIVPKFSAENPATVEHANKLWKQWANTTQCDAAGLTDFSGIQQLVMRAVVESGECFVRMRPRLPSDGLAVPMQLQVLEADFLCKHNDGALRNGNVVQNGIEYDAVGRRVAYYLYRVHPGGQVFNLQNNFGYSRVSAEEVIHVFRQDRPNQEIGASWLAPIIIGLRELSIYEDAYLNRQKIANLFAAFIKTENPDDIQEEFSTMDELTSGAMYLMRPGMDMQCSTPPKADDFGPYTLAVLRAIAAGLNITYESLTGDLSQVNFSSARMGWQEFGRSVDSWRWQLFIPRFCARVAVWFSQSADLKDLKADWTPPARIMVDPAREIPAIKEAVRSGLMTIPEAMREQGYDPDQQLAEIAEFNQKLDALGIALDSDARRPANGAAQPTQETQSNDSTPKTTN